MKLFNKIRDLNQILNIKIVKCNKKSKNNMIFKNLTIKIIKLNLKMIKNNKKIKNIHKKKKIKIKKMKYKKVRNQKIKLNKF